MQFAILTVLFTQKKNGIICVDFDGTAVLQFILFKKYIGFNNYNV